MPVGLANGRDFAAIAQKAGAVVIASALPIRDRQLAAGCVELDEFLAQCCDQ